MPILLKPPLIFTMKRKPRFTPQNKAITPAENKGPALSPWDQRLVKPPKKKASKKAAKKP